MVKKYVYGNPFNTEATTLDIQEESGKPGYGKVSTENGFSFTYVMSDQTKIYGLGQNVRGINKRGFEYISYCTDTPQHYEDAKSLYAAHNFIVIADKECFGLFIDYPSEVKFDLGYTVYNEIKITIKKADLFFYVIEGSSPYDIVKQFRKLIGKSYIPPKFAFGYGQSRWGYKTQEDFETVVRRHRENHIPLDMVYMDIDYMDGYRDFTVDEKEFPDFPAFVQQMKKEHIHLIPIIDAGVKIDKPEDEGKPGYKKYSVYEEGVEKGYFCKQEDGSPFVAAVWPGYTHFTDVLNKEARDWFGDKYTFLLEQGIDGFWNDMNEPAIFYTPRGQKLLGEAIRQLDFESEEFNPSAFEGEIRKIKNMSADYESFYHMVDGKRICHSDVHNLYGYNMTRAAGEAFKRHSPDKRILMFSRSSYIGMHRYGGIWMGDNLSWWSHLLMNLKMLPSLNMVGFLYIGADIGGFGSDSTRDLVLRWLALGVFTPLMRNHSAEGTRRQEFYQFEKIEDFRSVIRTRYRLVPYLYSEFMKAALQDDMMYKPLSFVYPDDEIACDIEDQLIIGNEVMIAPVYIQNAAGRTVYLPEDMLFLKFKADGSVYQEKLSKGLHYIKVDLAEVPMFVRNNKAIPIVDAAENIDDINMTTMQLYGYHAAEYALYDDDGVSRDYYNSQNYTVLKKAD